MPRLGDIYYVDFGPRSQDSRIEGPHYCVVVQSDLLNELPGYGTTIVCPITSKPRKSPTYVEVASGEETGLRVVSYIKCEQPILLSIPTLKDVRGRVGKDVRFLIKEALKIVFDQ